MNQQAQMNMPGMAGGPVGGPQMQAMNPGTPSNGMSQDATLTKLNTAIYDYLLRGGHYNAARELVKVLTIETKEPKQSPDSRAAMQANGVDDNADFDLPAFTNKPDDLPLAGAFPAENGPFLQDWWCSFWEIFHSRNAKRANPTSNPAAYVQIQRARSSGMNAMNQAGNQANMRNFNPMMGQNGMAMGDLNLKRAAMQNSQRNMTPQQIMQQANMKAAAQNGQLMQANQMERSGSNMDNRSGSPGSGDAPSPKRQRTDGGMQQMPQGRPGQPGQMQQGNPVGTLPDHLPPSSAAADEGVRHMMRATGVDPGQFPPNVIKNLSEQPPHVQTHTVEVYKQSMQAQMQAAMEGVSKQVSNGGHKGLAPNMGPGGAQGSPMSQPGMDGANGEFYAATNGGPRMPMQNPGAAAAAAGNGNGNHALQDYQMQLMLLEQQNKKRLLMARQEQDSMSSQPGGGNGPMGGYPPGSPSAGGQMMDPNSVPPQMRAQLGMGPNAQMMRGAPSSHPALNAHQMEMMRQNGVPMSNGQFAPGQQPPGMMPGQQPGQPGGPQGTPRQGNTNMPPPPAPAAGTQPSSPSQQPAPPTPSTANKPKAGNKKEAAKKGAANKKGAAAAAPASSDAEPPTPTPATPITPMNKQSFNSHNGGPAGPAGLTNGAPPTGPPGPPGQQAPPPPQQPDVPEPFGSINMDEQFGMSLDFDLGDSGNVLDSFDFDSFLNQDGDGGLGGFDANFAFGGGGGEGIGSGVEGGN